MLKLCEHYNILDSEKTGLTFEEFIIVYEYLKRFVKH